ncbi:MAG TPA: type IV toxin-antitoxin system AbiEi family antitoxin domain-containing protein [Thermoleophilia bacterium]|nr:type IV toxin-antitoxin system AbiEi family antitoxin domain-containing protein [Thermoleophilia bacterium]
MELSRGRRRLSKVLRATGQLITVAGATAALGVDRTTAAKLLARWQEQGWLKRVRRGLYAPVPLTAMPADQVIEDPWTLVPGLFDPAYVGGASAAHHWGLTEQLFRTVFVYTARPVRRSRQVIQAIPFVVRHVAEAHIFGTHGLWRGRIKVQVSDIHRTLIDLLNDPGMGGGIRHVADCLRAYIGRSDANLEILIAYGDRLGNGAVFKRLGFLAERSGAPTELVKACTDRLTQGNAKLDPALPCPRLLRRWRLWVPDRWKREASGND